MLLELSTHGNPGLAGTDDGDGIVREGVMIVAIVLGDFIAVELGVWPVRSVMVEGGREGRKWFER